MSIQEFIEKNSFIAIAIIFATGVTISWTVSEHLRVRPLELQLKRSEEARRNIYDVIIPRIIDNNSPSPEPAQQCEILSLYEHLAVAIEKNHRELIISMYAGNSSFSKDKCQALLGKYEPLVGTKVHFYISHIRHNDDRTVSVYAKAFCAGGKLINITDILIYEKYDWKLLDN